MNFGSRPDVVLAEGPGVTVTYSRLMVDGVTYPMATVNAVTTRMAPARTVGPQGAHFVFWGIAALFAARFIWDPAAGWVVPIVLFGMIGLICRASVKRLPAVYSVIVVVSGVPLRPFQFNDQGRAQHIFGAINEALARR